MDMQLSQSYTYAYAEFNSIGYIGLPFVLQYPTSESYS